MRSIQIDTSKERILQGIDKGEFSLLYQPRLCLSRRRVVSAEALIRWTVSDVGQIPPHLFIPETEKNGSIVQLGQWVLDQACRTALAWEKKGLQLGVSVNLSAAQFSNGLRQTIREALRDTGLLPSSLELEVTESFLLSQDNLNILSQIKDMGITIAIDDFGTGHSALSTLRSFNADVLKIDKEFFDDTPKDLDACLLTRSVIQLGHSLGMQVVCEGIERLEQLEFCELSEADQVQGFYFSKPLTSDAFIDFVRKPISLPDFEMAS